jgi:hypothetical protein
MRIGSLCVVFERLEDGLSLLVLGLMCVMLLSAIMPLGFAMIVGRLIWHASAAWHGRALAALGLCAPLLFWLVPEPQIAGWILPLSLLILFGTALGMPIYTALGSVALLFWHEGTPISLRRADA